MSAIISSATPRIVSTPPTQSLIYTSHTVIHSPFHSMWLHSCLRATPWTPRIVSHTHTHKLSLFSACGMRGIVHLSLVMRLFYPLLTHALTARHSWRRARAHAPSPFLASPSTSHTPLTSNTPLTPAPIARARTASIPQSRPSSPPQPSSRTPAIRRSRGESRLRARAPMPTNAGAVARPPLQRA
jgi:hypothetical protein